ncbi:NnrS family protein [Salipiger mucosus]|uniref:NnrS protein involved in response to NO n=1 Tax=Salipiger mucosus DSM 16094 TaxID=1123237 RepID=S9QDC0_9RHOB|nr:NnrS family protein [Salipiger mucosus]EPX77927.1 NnrS protein involved in response to NO [Salipiger mucosus DSM 16094]
MPTRNSYQGPALFSYGFRPFFLSAGLFALVAIAAWWLVWRGKIGLASHFLPVDWHIHEMVYGFGAAVVAGFLFTAVPNWTGRLPTRGWPLVLLLAVWLAGRLAVSGGTGLGPVAVAFVDQLFLLAVAAMIAREIVAGRNWRNLKVLAPVTLLWLGNVLFHVEAMVQGSADLGRRLGIALLIFLILLIGGRIVPSFTRNWLVQRGADRLPAAFNRFDELCLVAGAAALVAWVVTPYGTVCAAFGAVAALAHLVRLARWRGLATWRSPLLLMLHLAYLMAPLGFAAIALAALGLVAPASGAHVLGIGAVGGMTVAVMMRATMGHTGRPLVAGPTLTAAFVLVVAATAARVAGSGMVLGRFDGIDLSAGLWTVGFALLAVRIGPWLARPRMAAKAPSAAPRK